MSFEYNGVVYRDLEPQVRYDAEQVQSLKQADVAINENLQTINTEISGKLTKPANPSAESAVTMLADGTVGTKPLSEIGGGGMYRHDITKTINGVIITISFLDSKSVALTADEIYIKHSGNTVASVGYINNSDYIGGGGVLGAAISSNNITFRGVLYGDSRQGTTSYLYFNLTTVPDFLTDATYTVTEL